MKTRFQLFTLSEFSDWLNHTHVSRVITMIQNHHTKFPSYEMFNNSNHMSLLENMEYSHIVEKSYRQIAQNITTFPDGRIAVCRPLDIIPTGIVFNNQSAITVSHIGNFDEGCDEMTGRHQDCIIRLNALLCAKFRLNVSTSSVVYHSWFDTVTGKRNNGIGNRITCPGTNFFGGNSPEAAELNLLPAIRQAMSEMENFKSGRRWIKTGEINVLLLNVYEEPSMQSTVIKSFNKGNIIPVYEETDEWYKVHPTEQHWVRKRYLIEKV